MAMIDDFNSNYDSISAKMELTIDSQMQKLKDELAEYSIMPETLIDIISKTRSSLTSAVIQQSALSAISVLQQIAEDKMNDRRVRGFDDNMLMEITKMQGNVASFFVNASPSGAQAVLDDLKEMMQTISKRAELVTGSQPQIPS